MVKKRLESGEPCPKCVQTEEMLRRRGHWDRIDEVVWAIEGEPESPGMRLSAAHGVPRAPFFVVSDGDGDGDWDWDWDGDHGPVQVYESALKLIKERFTDAPESAAEVADAAATRAGPNLEDAEPSEILRWGLERYGAGLGIAFSGAEDVVLIDMAAEIGLPFSVFTLDTGRLHPETYEFIEKVRLHYGISIDAVSPDPVKLEPLVRKKGLFSFFEDGHAECCKLRKVDPLARALSKLEAWATGQRRDQSPETRGAVAAVELEASPPKLNPLAAWSSERVWDYIRERELPFNALHERGFRSIGCAPCTRPVLPGQPEREGRWWWEQSQARECGLHASGDLSDD